MTTLKQARDLIDVNLPNNSARRITPAGHREVQHAALDLFGVRLDGEDGFQAAINKAATRKEPLIIPPGRFEVEPADWTSFSSAGRNAVPPIIGSGRYTSVLAHSASDYLLTAGLSDGAIIKGVQIDTETGGGICITDDCGGLHFDDLFMHGCASGFAALRILSGDVYTATIERSRFWREQSEGSYQGRVIDMTGASGGLTVAFRYNFMSQCHFDGDLNVIHNCKNFLSESNQYEATNGAVTQQSLLALTGHNFNFQSVNDYFEGIFDVGFRVVSDATIGFDVRNLYAWARGFGAYTTKPDVTMIDVSNNALAGVGRVQGMVYKSSSEEAGSGYIINDPNGLLDLSGEYNNSLHAAQLSRAWKQAA